MKNTYIISLGGSLIVPEIGIIDWQFLKKFRELIIKRIKLGERFFIIAGGGATARNYIKAADHVYKTSDDDRDWLGIHSTRLNAHLLRTVFRDVAQASIIKNPSYRHPVKKKLIVAGGWKPGWSTDYVATLIAQEYDIKKIINLSNIDYAYSKDPNKYKDAEKIEKINWTGFQKIVGTKWSPGLNAPFDPIASQKSNKLNIEVAILNGKKINNLENYLNNSSFKGTVIKN
ncbi:UMP kinase [Candidatus Parcubacteria bacterium]|nr:MAG: UMP kinase [Candidatus Parcubacteria bacterium]